MESFDLAVVPKSRLEDCLLLVGEVTELDIAMTLEAAAIHFVNGNAVHSESEEPLPN